MPGITVAVLTDAGGAHVESYFAALAATEEVGSVVVADPSGGCEAAAKKTLGAKLKAFEREHAKALADHQPTLALVTLEAVNSPPVIRTALEANCHVLAEKPSCVKAEDFEPLVRLAEMKHRHLSLALANRLRGTVQAARKLIQSGQIGKIYGCELHIVADQTRLKNPAFQKSWFADRARSGGGHLMWLGIHWIDLIMHITGSKIGEVRGLHRHRRRAALESGGLCGDGAALRQRQLRHDHQRLLSRSRLPLAHQGLGLEWMAATRTARRRPAEVVHQHGDASRSAKVRRPGRAGRATHRWCGAVSGRVWISSRRRSPAPNASTCSRPSSPVIEPLRPGNPKR